MKETNSLASSLFLRRLVMSVGGVMLSSAAVGFFKCSLFGVDPFQCFAMGSWGKLAPSMAYGTCYMLLSLVMLAAVFFLDRHYIGIATFLNMFLTGYVVSFSQSVINRFAPEPGLLTRAVFLLIGVVVMCFASSLYMTSDLGVSVYDAAALVLSDRQSRVPFKFCRVFTDLLCVTIGTLCVLAGAKDGQLPGLGTLITAFFMGPLVDFFNRTVAQKLLEGEPSGERSPQ